MNAERTLELLSEVSAKAFGPSDERLYASTEHALGELVDFRLLTILRWHEPLLVRMHSSAPSIYPAGGSKDITDDRWLRSLLADGVPVLSENEAQVRERFFDHEAIFAMGCGSALNVPVMSSLGPLGSINLLHAAHWYRPEHARWVQPFATALALFWLGQDLRAARSNGSMPAG